DDRSTRLGALTPGRLERRPALEEAPEAAREAGRRLDHVLTMVVGLRPAVADAHQGALHLLPIGTHIIPAEHQAALLLDLGEVHAHGWRRYGMPPWPVRRVSRGVDARARRVGASASVQTGATRWRPRTQA